MPNPLIAQKDVTKMCSGSLLGPCFLPAIRLPFCNRLTRMRGSLFQCLSSKGGSPLADSSDMSSPWGPGVVSRHHVKRRSKHRARPDPHRCWCTSAAQGQVKNGTVSAKLALQLRSSWGVRFQTVVGPARAALCTKYARIKKKKTMDG